MDFSNVGEQEFAVVSEKVLTSQQLKKVSKAILRMGFAMGLSEGLGSNVAMAQQCKVEQKLHSNIVSWICACFVFCVIHVVVCAAVWKGVQKMMRQMDERIQSLARDVASVEQQLADHSEYAGDLGTRLDGVDMRFENVDDSFDTSAARIATLEEMNCHL